MVPHLVPEIPLAVRLYEHQEARRSRIAEWRSEECAAKRVTTAVSAEEHHGGKQIWEEGEAAFLLACISKVQILR